MKDCARFSRFPGGIGNQKGASALTFLGFAIVAVCVIGAIFFFPWQEVFHGGQDADLVAAKEAMAKKNWKGAIASFDKAIKSNPDNVDAHMGRSRAYLQSGNLAKALEDANFVIDKKSNNAAAFAQRGMIKKLQQKPDDALQDFTQAIRLDPGFSWALAQRADLHYKQKNYEKARIDIDKALAGKPKFVEGLRLKAWILTRLGKCNEAAAEFKKIETLSPNDPWTVQDKAWFLLTCPDEKLQDPSKALELAKKAVELSAGRDGVIYETLAEAYFRQGDALKAFEFQKKAIELGSKKCPDGSCTKEMEERLQKYEMASRQEIRSSYEILPSDGGDSGH